MSTYIWAAPVVATVTHGFFIIRSSRQQILQKPELEPGYKQLFTYTVFLAIIPWVIMAIGDILELAHPDDYLQFKIDNIVVAVYYLSVILLICFTAWWIFFKKGAEIIETHPVQRSFFDTENVFKLNAKQIKIAIGICLFAALSAIFVLGMRSIGAK